MSLLAVLTLLMASCASTAKYTTPTYERPHKIAILPTINQTIDVKGAIVFRNICFEKLKDYKYSEILANDTVDSILNEKGITDGGQLKTIDNEELLDALKVDGILFIELLACEYKTLGISETRHVKADLKLYTHRGLVWDDEREVDHGKSAVSTLLNAFTDLSGTLRESARDLGKQLATKGVKGWLMDHELKPEMIEVIDTALGTLPR
ncbi:MAG: DUF799 family lipoprotein [Nitrospirae bacterium]|nr:DUF799 family lipoprotein [Nitrospirota bacterium]